MQNIGQESLLSCKIHGNGVTRKPTLFLIQLPGQHIRGQYRNNLFGWNYCLQELFHKA